ncbi:MAG: CinA family protein [Lachnospiraceae bacterium]|nr:CinA family protein [Lachnospiraceae bacterium]
MSLEERAVQALTARGCEITTAESCTGGMLASMLVNAAGASEIFKEGYITYSNEAKSRLLGVDAQALERYGAVSETVARQMAEGAAAAAGATAALSVTGIAGPGGGTKEKPVGLVYIGCYLDGTTTAERNLFHGSRLEIREASARRALELLLARMEELGDGETVSR